MRNTFNILCLLASMLLLGGCKEVLYSELSESEANEMVAVLAASNVASSRTRDKDGIYTLSVEAKLVADAIVILRADGYPKAKFQSLGDVFNSDGIIGTPFEQHARFIYAMNEELSNTLSSISGVRQANVLTTAPLAGRYDRTAPPATASVTIHYEEDFDVSSNISNFKRLVAAAVPNLEYENVTVSVFKARGVPTFPTGEVIAVEQIVSAPTAPLKLSGVATGASNLLATSRLISIAAFLAAAYLVANIIIRRSRRQS